MKHFPRDAFIPDSASHSRHTRVTFSSLSLPPSYEKSCFRVAVPKFRVLSTEVKDSCLDFSFWSSFASKPRKFHLWHFSFLLKILKSNISAAFSSIRQIKYSRDQKNWSTYCCKSNHLIESQHSVRFKFRLKFLFETQAEEESSRPKSGNISFK